MVNQTDRQREILAFTQAHGHCSVTDLAAKFRVTQETIRRDLKSLEEEGRLERVHGGAIVTEREFLAEQPFDASERAHVPEKDAIAAAALRFIPGGSASILLDAGTTTALLASKLAQSYSGQRWTIMTNSLPGGMALSVGGVPGVHILGGAMRTFTRAVVGEPAISTLHDLQADVAFLGTNGLSAWHGASTPDPSEAAMKRAMVRAAKRVVVLCDSSKFDADFLVTFCDFEDIDDLITDSAPPEPLAAALANNEVDVTFA